MAGMQAGQLLVLLREDTSPLRSVLTVTDSSQ